MFTKNIKLPSNAGFSLVELMAVVAIVSILASMAMSMTKKVVVQSRQVEAKLTLSALHALMESIAVANDGCYVPGCPSGGLGGSVTPSLSSDCNGYVPDFRIGLKVSSCQKSRYHVYMSIADSRTYEATAVENQDPSNRKLIYPKCSDKWDVWLINQNKTLTNYCLTAFYGSYAYNSGMDSGNQAPGLCQPNCM